MQINREEDIAQLVKNVRNLDCEISFAVLRNYLLQYMKCFSRTYRIPGCDADEIEQECLVALKDKAIKDFDATRGKFKNFAILCIKRHLFSLIKSNNQQKRKVLNQSISLNSDRSDDEDNLTLSDIVVKQNELSADDEISKNENFENKKRYLLSKCSELEKHVLKLYLEQRHYDEIVIELIKIFPGRKKKFSKKTVDNSLVRLRSKAQKLSLNRSFFEE